jgi:hypothetical protein
VDISQHTHIVININLFHDYFNKIISNIHNIARKLLFNQISLGVTALWCNQGKTFAIIIYKIFEILNLFWIFIKFKNYLKFSTLIISTTAKL